jgi:hypothetical protein
MVLVSVGVGLYIFYITSKKLRYDLKTGEIKKITKILINKDLKIDYEPGSATMPVTILSFLTPKIFKGEMRQVNIYKAWTDEGEFLITKEEFEKINVNDKILVRRGYHSDLFLGIEGKNYA